MEESEQRRERLKAMRIEAAGAAVDASSELAASGGLSNPLVEGQNTSTPTQHFSPRFDFYTDPMAAFSGTRRRDNITPHLSHNMPPRPTYQVMTPDSAYPTPGINSPDQRIFQVPGAQFNQRPLWRPMELATPSSTPQGNPPNAWGGPGRPFNNAYPSGRPQGNHPNDWGGPGGSFNYPTLSNMPRGSNFGNPSFGQEGSYYGRGRGQRYNSSSHYESGRGGNRYPDSGRGRGRSLSNSTSPGSRMGGRRGGSHESVSAEVRPDLYYRKEMVEDPWKMLTPVIWKDTHAKDAGKSWLPKSITMKKAKVSTEFPQTSISQPSLAEYLASSFSDSTNEPGSHSRQSPSLFSLPLYSSLPSPPRRRHSRHHHAADSLSFTNRYLTGSHSEEIHPSGCVPVSSRRQTAAPRSNRSVDSFRRHLASAALLTAPAPQPSAALLTAPQPSRSAALCSSANSAAALSLRSSAALSLRSPLQLC